MTLELSRGKLQAAVMIVLCLSGIFLISQTKTQNAASVEQKTIVIKRKDAAERRCFDVCNARRKLRNDRFNGDLLDNKEMLRLATAEIGKMVSKLKVDYGPENFSRIFEMQNDGLNETRYKSIEPVNEDGKSLARFKQKLQMKILSVQSSIKNIEKNVYGCDCINGDKPIGDNPIEVDSATDFRKVDPSYARYVWVTGGHSASAGHGNLYNETYTVFLERAVKGVFGAIGVEFEGRNYAMGGTG
jgi:hypothetical protein